MSDLPSITCVHCVYSSCWDVSSNEVLPVVRANIAFSILMTAVNPSREPNIPGVPSVIQIMVLIKMQTVSLGSNDQPPKIFPLIAAFPKTTDPLRHSCLPCTKIISLALLIKLAISSMARY